jgi:predicted component of type VI protein secretion system
MSERITLVIDNPWRLPRGYRAVQHFDRAGGSLGSQGCDWPLSDHADGVQPLHCEVRWREGSFCVIDRCGRTYMNDARLSLPPGRWVRIGAGDGLRVGDYRIDVHVSDDDTATPALHAGQPSLDQLFDGHRCPLRALGPALTRTPPLPARHAPSLDPLAALEASARPACAIGQLLGTRLDAYTRRTLPQEAS